MGRPIVPTEPLWQPGQDCPLGNNILWLVGKTPYMVKVFFRDIAKCPPAPAEPPNGTYFKLEQLPGEPCVWEIITGTGWRVTWALFPTGSALALYWHATGGPFFLSPLEPPCTLFFPTNLLTCPYSYAEGGRGAVLVEPDDIPRTMAIALGLTTLGMTRFDRAPAGASYKTVKLCERKSATNLWFRIDTP